MPLKAIRTLFRLLTQEGPIVINGSKGEWGGGKVKAEAEETYSFETGEHAELVVSNAHGSVNVAAWDRPSVEMKVQKGASAKDEEQAQRALDAIEIEVKHEGARVEARTRYENIRRSSVWVNYEIHVPSQTDLTVQNRHGKVVVSRIEGQADLQVEHGGCEIEEVLGGLSARSRHGGISVSHVQGDTTLRSEHGGISAGRIEGALNVTARHGSVQVDDLRGNFRVRVEHGKLRMNVHPEPTGECTAESHHGGIVLALPEDTDPSIHASGHHSAVRSDFEFDHMNRDHTSQTATRAGTGPEIRVQAHHGNIAIRMMDHSV